MGGIYVWGFVFRARLWARQDCFWRRRAIAERRVGSLGVVMMAGQPGPDLVLLVRRVVVEDHVDSLFLRHFALDTIEEADIGGRGMGMP